MNFVYELIHKEKPEISKENFEYIVSTFNNFGAINYTVQYHYEIYKFYNELLQHYSSINLNKKCAIVDTMQHFKISRGYLYMIIKKFSEKLD
jgi:hypothetical protein